jgi:hypothetical protein
MDFMYYICGNGTENGRKKDIDNMSVLLGMGYIGFTESVDDRIMVFRPFGLGAVQNGQSRRIGKNYQIGFRTKI